MKDLVELEKLRALRQALDDLPLVMVADTIVGAHAVQAVINAARAIVGGEFDPKPGAREIQEVIDTARAIVGESTERHVHVFVNIGSGARCIACGLEWPS